MKYFLFIFLMHFSCIQLFAQEDSIPPKREIDTSAVRKMPRRLGPREKEKEPEPEEVTIKDYKIISYARDTTFLDTTLTIQKEYKYNYLRKDDFELMPFANVGKPYNKLGVDFNSNNLYPSLGANALHSNYFEKEDIKYYNVATPMSDLFFKTTFEQGQLLDANLTFNTSRRLNFSIAYKGFRSLGKYQYNQSESGNFRTTTNYVTENGRYSLRAHIAAQDIENEENGGLISAEAQFESGDPEFSDRVKADVRFGDASSKILGKRYFLDHLYKLIRKEKDSSHQEKTSLGIGHQFNYETKYYAFNQTTPNTYYGDNLISPIEDKASLKTMYNQINAEFYNATLGRLQGNISIYNYNYFFNSILIDDNGVEIPSRLKGEEIAVGAEYEKRIKGFQLKATAKYNLSGNLGGNQMNASASYMLNDKHKVTASAFGSSKMPDFNFLLYQSDYRNYNWMNLNSFEKEQTYGLRFDLESELWGNLMVSYSTVDNYTYFGQAPSMAIEEGMENANISPLQENNVLNHTKIKYAKEFKLGKFALNNTVMYQNVSQANQVLNVPEVVTRNTLYFSSDVFKKAMFLQTGITLKYFTSYNMDAYNSLLGEFYLQNDEKLGNFPMLDFFINAKIQQTRIYLKAEHFNSSFSNDNYYAAPNYPYRDFVIRFGLVWNFFS
ncbi:putative porin [Zobellia alginiliquefaciens]|uniref:putative porin n=1 Tax=Zobellia alginiliquefaciens TaxID=3032586 RepID=UPI0023E28B0D|nr:putative porin [Zobellia alginiliquefaciens]